MVTIRHVEVTGFAIPLITPLATACGSITIRRGFVLRLHADRGLVGTGEALPHPAAPAEALARTGAALKGASWLPGADAIQLEGLLARGSRLELAAAAALDMALHDLIGRASGRAVSELLGGCRRPALAASALLEGETPAAAAAAAEAAVGQGFTTSKLKASADLDVSVARVAAVRAAAPRLAVRVDCNGSCDPERAVAFAMRLVPYGLEWLEQPVSAGDVAGLARVRREGGVPVAADESVTGCEAVAALAAAGAADVVVLKLVQVGGLARALAAARTAAAAGLALTVTTALDTGIGTAAALHLGCALPEPVRVCGVATGHLLAGDLLRVPIADAPFMSPPPGPGLGIELDPAALARWRTDAPE